MTSFRLYVLKLPPFLAAPSINSQQQNVNKFFLLTKLIITVTRIFNNRRLKRTISSLFHIPCTSLCRSFNFKCLEMGTNKCSFLLVKRNEEYFQLLVSKPNVRTLINFMKCSIILSKFHLNNDLY